jgi:hypothetical protein
MTTEYFICVTCGTQFGPADQPPDQCPICSDERQYVGHRGQMWTTMSKLRLDHRNILAEEESDLFSVRTQPKCAIGQRALLVRTDEGILLWDCVPLIDRETVASIESLGGLRGIAVSHPHYYTAMVEWSQAFSGVPIYLHQNDSRWVMRPDNAVRFWEGEQYSLFGGLSLVCIGGHFDGFQVLHWQAGAARRGVLLVGDQPFVCQDRRWVSFMYSYPNLIPLAPDAVRNILDRLTPLGFDRLYGAFPDQRIASGAKEAVSRSATRYLQALGMRPL